ncbi:site-specific integrase [Flavobacteriaceae bacterium]|nr:site-specific integrase [Flavobacteriaceae bacterium]
MPKIGFRIRSTKSKSGSILVNFRPPSSPPLEVRTGLSTDVSLWSKDKQRSKGIDASLVKLNSRLSKLSVHLEEAINNSDGADLNNKWLKKEVDKFFNRAEKKDSIYLLNFYADYLRSIENNKGGSVGLKPNTVKVYRSFYKILVKYESAIEARLRFDNLDKDAFDDLYSYLINEEGYSPSHVGRQITRLKTLCRAASGEGIKVNSYHLIHKAKPVHSDKHLTIITQDEIDLIKSYTPENNYLKNTKKWMLIGIYIGQRVSDLLSITPSQVRVVEPGVVLVDILQKKTGVAITIPIKDSVVIDILLHNFPNKIANSNFNKYLKLLLKAANVNEETTGYLMSKNGRRELVTGPKWMFVSSHDLRRSFATNHYLNGVPTQYLMKMTGHLRESSFLLYIGKSANKDEDALTFMKYL